jgi:hypothetical protein
MSQTISRCSACLEPVYARGDVLYHFSLIEEVWYGNDDIFGRRRSACASYVTLTENEYCALNDAQYIVWFYETMC